METHVDVENDEVEFEKEEDLAVVDADAAFGAVNVGVRAGRISCIIYKKRSRNLLF